MTIDDVAALQVVNSFVNLNNMSKCFLAMTCKMFARECSHFNMNPLCDMTFISNCRISGPGKVSSLQLSLQNCVTFVVIEHQC